VVKVVHAWGARPWALIRRSAAAADVLARGPRGKSSPGDWRPAVERIRDGDGELAVDATADGHYQWTLTRGQAVIAESPAIYRDPRLCRDAFATAQHAADEALGHPDPRAQRLTKLDELDA
jgi:hypothetical protein